MNSRIPLSLFKAVLCLTVCGTLNIVHNLAYSIMTPDSDIPTAFYQAPPHYSISSANKRPLQSFIITSKPLNFPTNASNGGDSSSTRKTDSRLPKLPTRNKASFTNIPGVAMVVCKGSTCANSPLSFSDLALAHKDGEGFAGEAIPIDANDEYFTVIMNNANLREPVLLPPPKYSHSSTPLKTSTSSSTSVVSLLTQRPYLKHDSSTRRRTTMKRRSTIRNRKTSTAPPATTTTMMMTTTTMASRTRTKSPLRRRTPVIRQSATTAKTPTASVKQPVTISFGRPSLLFPAAAAFSLMALPVAAAAVPLLLSTAGRRKRRSVPAFLPNGMNPGSDPDFELPTQDVQGVLQVLDSIEHELGSLNDQSPKLLVKARNRIEHIRNRLKLQKDSDKSEY